MRPTDLRALVALLALGATAVGQDTEPAPERWLEYPGADGPGAGRRIVLIAADQEYAVCFGPARSSGDDSIDVVGVMDQVDGRGRLP